jgi:hypothetical protein
MGDRKIHTKFWPEDLKRPFWRPRCRWENNIKIQEKWVVNMWTGFTWLMIGFNGKVLRTW